MKKIILFACLTAALVFAVAPAQADRGGIPHHKNTPTAPVLSFSCDGARCVYAVSPGPLTALTAYDTSIMFVGADGGCNMGTGGWHTDASGALIQVLDEDAIKCGHDGPGTVTAWVRGAGSAWDAPAIPGTSIGPVVIA